MFVLNHACSVNVFEKTVFERYWMKVFVKSGNLVRKLVDRESFFNQDHGFYPILLILKYTNLFLNAKM